MKEWWVIVMLSSGSGTGDYSVQVPDIPVFSTKSACIEGLNAYEKGIEEAIRHSNYPNAANFMANYICAYRNGSEPRAQKKAGAP